MRERVEGEYRHMHEWDEVHQLRERTSIVTATLLRQCHGLAGRAAVPYPSFKWSPLGRSLGARQVFRRAERFVFAEIRRAPDSRGADGFPRLWSVSEGAAQYKLYDWQFSAPDLFTFPVSFDLAQRAVGAVVEWLGGHDTIRLLPADQRKALMEAGKERRRAAGIKVDGFISLADETAWRDEERARAEDSEIWVISRSEMLSVYPGLARIDQRWRRE